MTSKFKLWSFIFILVSGAILLPVLAYAQIPIDCGQTLAGSISAAAEKDSFTFTALANDGITIRARKTSGNLTPYLELYAPSGSLITSAANKIDRVLTVTGTYRIDVRDQNNTSTGDYVLLWQRMSNPCNAVAVDCGQVVTGSIGTSADPPPWRFHTFTVSANDAVTIRVANTSGGSFAPYSELYGPNGVYITAGSVLDRVLTTAGTYTVLVRDSANTYSGNYVWTWQKVKGPCNASPAGCGQMVSGSITGAGQMVAYTFTGSANDGITIRIRKTSGTFSPYIELYNPSGTRIGGPSNQINVTLSVTGEYTILVRDQNNLNTGGYIITWQRFNNPCAPAINCGQTTTGAIGITPDAPPWGFYSFTVGANDIVTIRAIKTSGTLAPYLELYNGTGGLVASAGGQINQTMPAGTYVLLLRDQSSTNTGDYAVTWQRWNNPCATAANCGQVMTESIGITADPPPWRYYSFTASANDIVTIRANKTSGTLIPYLELYATSGTQIGTAAGQMDKALTAAGTYTIVVRDQNSINTGDYVLSWNRINNTCNAPSIGCGQVFPGSVAVVGKIDAYTFTAAAGDNIVLTLTRTSGGFDPSLELYNSSGTRMGYQYTPSGNEVTLTQTLSAAGTYTLFASDYGNDETGTYKLKFQKNNNSCTDVSLVLPIGGESIPARSTFTIRWSCTSPPGVTSQEIRLSADGGLSFPTLIVSGLAGDLRTYNWDVPSDLSTNQARIRVIVTDGSAVNVFDDSDSDFTVFQGVGRIYIYDELNRLIQVLYEDGRRITYTYDASGNRITLTNEQ